MTSEILEALENISIDANAVYDALVRIVRRVDSLKDNPDLSPIVMSSILKMSERAARTMYSGADLSNAANAVIRTYIFFLEQ